MKPKCPSCNSPAQMPAVYLLPDATRQAGYACMRCLHHWRPSETKMVGPIAPKELHDGDTIEMQRAENDEWEVQR